MNQDIESFFKKAGTDAELGAKVKGTTDVEGLVALAKEEGFSFEAAELAELATTLSDEQLEAVSGGTSDVDAIILLLSQMQMAAFDRSVGLTVKQIEKVQSMAQNPLPSLQLPRNKSSFVSNAV